MIKSTILESLKVYKEYLNGNDSQVEAVEVSLSVKVQFDAKIIKALRKKLGTTQAT